MKINAENYGRVLDKYNQKRLKAEIEADERKKYLKDNVPGIGEIDGMLSGVGMKIMSAFAKSEEDGRKALEEIKRENRELLKRRAELLKKSGFPENYSDVRYECEKCRDTGFVGEKMCPCMKRALVMANCESSGMADLIRTQTFENFSLDFYKDDPQVYATMDRNLRTAFEYAQNFHGRGSGNLLFIGATGLGKTHVSSAIAKAVIENERKVYDVYYAGAQKMMSDFADDRFGGYGQANRETVEKYFDTDLLIIDDLGTEVNNQFTAACVFNVINSRLNDGKSTIVNTNLSVDELRSRYSDRIVSRLLGEYATLRFLGRDVRMQKLKQGATRKEK